MNKNIGLIFLGAFIATGLSLSGYFVGQTLYNAKVALNTAVVRGLAEKRVIADTATWAISFSVSGKSRQQVPALYHQAEQHQQAIVRSLKESGFIDTEINIGVIDYSNIEYRNNNQTIVDQTHQLEAIITVTTQKVNEIAPARRHLNNLISQGINIKNNLPAYQFTQLNAIKPEMLKEATTNARVAANEFAKNAGVSVGSIRNARQGNFQIIDVGEQYSDSLKIEKNVRVVTSIEFYLTDK